MPSALEINTFLAQSETHTMIDVRSPSEFQYGHIPGAVNIPLFSDEERAKVGKTYKHAGSRKAILEGMQIAGTKMADYCRELDKIARQKEILVYCWRGGMRSKSMAWLFETYGYKTSTLIRGYKAYRNKVISDFGQKAYLIILGGMTGSGKTQILHELKNRGEQIIDLEATACHKGSAFGFIGQPVQPSSEQFQNNLHADWQKLDLQKPVWLEDESIRIGNVFIPEKLFAQMQQSPLIIVEADREVRIKRLVEEYSKTDDNMLILAITRIERRLGGYNAKEAINAIETGDYYKAADIILSYYDKAYAQCLAKKDPSHIHFIGHNNGNPSEMVIMVTNLYLSALSGQL